MYGQVYHLELPRSAHSVYLCVAYGSETNSDYCLKQYQLTDFS